MLESQTQRDERNQGEATHMESGSHHDGSRHQSGRDHHRGEHRHGHDHKHKHHRKSWFALTAEQRDIVLMFAGGIIVVAVITLLLSVW